MITDAKYVAERDRRVALLDKLIEDFFGIGTLCKKRGELNG